MGDIRPSKQKKKEQNISLKSKPREGNLLLKAGPMLSSLNYALTASIIIFNLSPFPGKMKSGWKRKSQTFFPLPGVFMKFI